MEVDVERSTVERIRRFQRLTDPLLSVSKTELDACVKAHRERAALNPNKRGPKPKRVTDAS